MKFKSEKMHKVKSNYIYICFTLYIMTLFINNLTFYMMYEVLEKSVKIIRYVLYIIFAFRILSNWKNGKNITIPTIIAIITSVLVCIYSKNIDIGILVLSIMALRDTDFDKLIKISFYIFTTMFCIIVSLSLLKILPDWTYTRSDSGIVRHSLGFYYPTITIGLYLAMVLMYFYIRRNKCSWLEILVLETMNVFLYSYTDGRLSFILITIILGAMALSKIEVLKRLFETDINQKILRLVIYVLPIILFIVAILITVLYINKTRLGLKLDQILSGRLKYTSEAFERYQLTPFGQNIKWNGWGGHGYIEENDFLSSEYNFVDISYARILFDYGIITTILILYMYTKVLIENYNKKNYWMCFTLIFVLIWSFVEPYIVYIGKNIFVLTFGIIINNGIEVKALNYDYLKGRIKKENGKEINN